MASLKLLKSLSHFLYWYIYGTYFKRGEINAEIYQELFRSLKARREVL